MKREEVCACIKEIGILPSVRVNTQELARFAAETVYSSGIPIVEITLTVPGALGVINDLASRYPDMAVGAGTVLDDEAARRCVDAGARFLTSPGLVLEVVAYARKVDVAVLPGLLLRGRRVRISSRYFQRVMSAAFNMSALSRCPCRKSRWLPRVALTS
jgi:2-dehydro-3-deoxyphosphogluconate aldolase/(4S)-4-hydroxy-2-oxoglutarate aldolase